MSALLDPERLRGAIPSHPVAWNIHYVETTDSTNRVARRLGHGAAVITDFQEAGRGRRGRSWLAPAGSSVLMTAVLDLPVGIGPTGASMIAALAVRDGLREISDLGTTIKWPNDIVVDARRKVGGILLEGLAIPGGTRALIGMGINCNFPADAVPGLPGNATSLQSEVGQPIARERLIGVLLREIGRWYDVLVISPAEVFDEWRSSLVTIGQTVRVEGLEGEWDGEALDVRRDGALLVRTADGKVRPVLAADVSIRAKD